MSSKVSKTSSKKTSTKKSKKDRTSKRSKAKKEKSTKKAATPKTPVEEVVEEVTPAPATTTRKRRVVDRDSVFADFDALVQSVETEIESIRSASNGKVSGVKFLRSLNKSLKQLKKDTTRAMKQKRRNPNRAKNTSSGFMKPVAISGEMSKFTGWDADELKSRVDVTKYICGYIRDHDLQNPADRRQIVPDKKLTALLKLDKKSLKEEPLTYYSLQKKIQPHFVSASK
jgi:chromatin remodeling complex protein RSC6